MNQKLTYKDRISQNLYFFVPYIIFLIFGAVILVNTQKGDVLLTINNYHNTFLDNYFVFFSILGEGGYFGIFLLFMALYRIKHLFNGVILYLAGGAVTQILKRIFNDPRPISYFADTVNLYLVDGITIHSWNSFPSGHSVSGFTIFLFFAFLTKSKPLGLVYFFLAFSVALSRVYLVQHFFIDIYFGSIIGVLTTLILMNIFDNSQKLNNSKWYNYSLVENKISFLKFKKN